MKNTTLELAAVTANQICQDHQDFREFLESKNPDIVGKAKYAVHNPYVAGILLEATELMVSQINQIPMNDKLLIKADKIKNEVRFLKRKDPNILIASKIFLANLKRFEYVLNSKKLRTI